MRTIPALLGFAAIACTAPLLAQDSDGPDIRERTLTAIDGLDERGQKIGRASCRERV